MNIYKTAIYHRPSHECVDVLCCALVDTSPAVPVASSRSEAWPRVERRRGDADGTLLHADDIAGGAMGAGQRLAGDI